MTVIIKAYFLPRFPRLYICESRYEKGWDHFLTWFSIIIMYIMYCNLCILNICSAKSQKPTPHPVYRVLQFRTHFHPPLFGPLKCNVISKFNKPSRICIKGDQYSQFNKRNFRRSVKINGVSRRTWSDFNKRFERHFKVDLREVHYFAPAFWQLINSLQAKLSFNPQASNSILNCS